MSFVLVLLFAYLVVSLAATYLVHQLPRDPVSEFPDWGEVQDSRIPTPDGGFLEVWKVLPQGPSRGVVVFAHGWGRNRDRMTPRARVLGRMGFTAVMHSARDHGGSSKKRGMQAEKFAQDIATVLDWVKAPVILYGHSAGAGGAIIAAARAQSQVKLLILEGCYTYTRPALLGLYMDFNKAFGLLLGPMILVWMTLFYGRTLDGLSPARLAGKLPMPVLLVHGEKDEKFPVAMARTLQGSFAPGQASLYVAPGAGHSDSPSTPGYQDAVRDFVEKNFSRLASAPEKSISP